MTMSTSIAKEPLKMGRVLIVAGSDSSGGAGIQADIKTVTMLGQYAATAITAITVQNTLGVSDVCGMGPALINAQIRAVVEDVGADTIKTGMLHSSAVIEGLIETLDELSWGGALIVDPVMVATSGDRLVDKAAIKTIRTVLLPRASIVTPNIPEAEVLTGHVIQSVDDMKRAAETILSLGAEGVLLKGGHLPSETLTDILVTQEGIFEITSDKIQTRHTHGTGCTLASALAALIASGMDTKSAFQGAHAFVREAIIKAPELGSGHGPLGHAHVREALPW